MMESDIKNGRIAHLPERLVYRLSHRDARERAATFDKLLSSGKEVITSLLPLLEADDEDTRIAALNLCCLLDSVGVKGYLILTRLDPGDINVAAVMIEILGRHGNNIGDLVWVEELVKSYKQNFTDYAGKLATAAICERINQVNVNGYE